MGAGVEEQLSDGPAGEQEATGPESQQTWTGRLTLFPAQS